MIAATSVFSRTNRMFESAGLSTLTRHELGFLPASRMIQASSQLFQVLDRADPAQAEVSRRLWVLRSSILFSILPFDDPALQLLRQVDELEQSSTGLPEAKRFLESLKESVADVLSARLNPKREWIIRTLNESPESEGDRVGVLCALSAGRAPGWPLERLGLLAELSDRIVLVKSRKQLRADLFGAVVLPCACQTAPFTILSELLFSGVAAKFDVLLYPGERFQLPKRLVLPSDNIFTGKLRKSRIENDLVVIPDALTLSAEDVWMNEAFWQGLHGAQRSSSPDLVPANYLLFCDGTGTFLPESGGVLTIPADGNVMDDGDLRTVRVEDIGEEDLIVLRSGESGFLLDEASDRIMSRSSNEALLDTATDWKYALDALLVTLSKQEIAQELTARGVPTRPGSVQQWAGPAVLGPGDERAFRELMHLLADKGKIHMTGEALIGYVNRCWHSLQELRGLRQKAGNLIRQDLFKALFSRFEVGNRPLADRETIHVVGDTDAELLILRVSSVDRNTAHVHASRLGQIEDLKGNKWLG